MGLMGGKHSTKKGDKNSDRSRQATAREKNEQARKRRREKRLAA